MCFYVHTENAQRCCSRGNRERAEYIHLTEYYYRTVLLHVDSNVIDEVLRKSAKENVSRNRNTERKEMRKEKKEKKLASLKMCARVSTRRLFPSRYILRL